LFILHDFVTIQEETNLRRTFLMSSAIPEEIEAHRQPDHEIHPQFLTRWSPRAFKEQEVPNDVLHSIFEAARWAPSSNNLQPWRYIVARTSEQRSKFLEFINPSNVEWCQKAPVLAVVASQTKAANGNDNGAHAFDAGTSWGFLALEAANQGLITHAMGGFDKAKARVILHVPEDCELHAVIAIGYRGAKESLSERNLEREFPSARNPVGDMVFEGDFGQKLS
jgi:nitroreductase